MADRVSDLNVRVAPTSFPSITISTAQAKAFQGIAATLGKVSDILNNQLDREAVLAGKRAGTVAGATTTPTMKDETTLYGAAFNDAARQTYANQLDMNARLKLAELETQYKADPVGFKNATDGYLLGVTSQVAETDPAIAAIFKQSFDFRRAVSAAKIRDTFSNQARDNAKASVVQMQTVIERDLTKDGADLLSKDPEVSTGFFLRYSQDRLRLDQAMAQLAPDGTPVYSAEDRAKALIKFDDAVFVAAARGMVDAAPNKKAVLIAIQTGQQPVGVNVLDDATGKVETKTFNLLDRMTRTQREHLINYATEQANLEARQQLAEETKATKAFKREQEINSIRLFGDAIRGELRLADVEDVRMELEPGDYRLLAKLAKGGGAVTDTAAGIATAEEAMTTARRIGDFGPAMETVKWLTEDGQLTVDTMGRYMGEVTAMTDKDGPKSLFNQMLGTFNDLIVAAQQAPGAKYTSAFTIPIAKNDFTAWFQGFKDQTDPATGKPFGRNPTRDEAKAMTLELLKGAVQDFTGAGLEKAFLGVGRPVAYLDNNRPGAVFAPDGRVDVEKTKANYFAAFPGVDTAQPLTWPDGLKKLFVDMDRYINAVDHHQRILERINGIK